MTSGFAISGIDCIVSHRFNRVEARMPAPNFDKTIWTGDNLDILRGMNSETVRPDIPRSPVQLQQGL